MKLNELVEINEYFQPNLYEMSNYSSDDTGLSTGTMLWIRTEPKGLPHTKYRIKVEHPRYGSAVYAIWGDEPIPVAGNWKLTGKDLKKLNLLIKLMHLHLRNHIDGLESSGQLELNFLKVKDQIEVI